MARPYNPDYDSPGKIWREIREERRTLARRESDALLEHPLFDVFRAAIEQAMYGKGERHGGAVTPFLEQPWLKLAESHGSGFLTGQAVKKIEEAVRGKDGEQWEREMLGGLVYIGMAIIYNRIVRDRPHYLSPKRRSDDQEPTDPKGPDGPIATLVGEEEPRRDHR
jgi:hypothetical protein